MDIGVRKLRTFPLKIPPKEQQKEVREVVEKIASHLQNEEKRRVLEAELHQKIQAIYKK